MKIPGRGLRAWALASLLVMAAAGAAAESVSGKGAVYEKDVAARSLRVGETRLAVAPDAVIVGPAGTRISLADLAVIERRNGGGIYVLSAEAVVRWQGEERAGVVVADRIEVVGIIRH